MSWSNYDSVLMQMRQIGLMVDDLRTERMVRCRVEDAGPEKRGWYRLHTWDRVDRETGQAECLLVGSFGIFRGAKTDVIKVELPERSKANSYTAEERAALRQRMADDRRAADAARKQQIEQAARRATSVWHKLPTTGVCDYPERKQVGVHGLRYTESGAIAVPMLDTRGHIHGLQFILGSSHPRRRKGGPDKMFWPAGMGKTGRFFSIGAPRPGGVILIAEGYATAATLFDTAGHPVIVAFDAGNLLPVASEIHKHYKGARLLICADDDYLTEGNPGVTAAQAAALATGGQVLVPQFTVDRQAKKLTDFNDLAALEGQHVVRAQVEACLRRLGWDQAAPAARTQAGGGGAKPDDTAPPTEQPLRLINDECQIIERFSLVYEMADVVFDHQEHQLVPIKSMTNLCIDRRLPRRWMECTARQVVRKSEVGFDPEGTDANIRCNLWGGWPTKPQRGGCETLLELLAYLCSAEKNADDLYRWVLKWLAYPIQHPGAKMRTALVLHGPQGTGKNMFFEAYMAIFGQYGRIIDQSAVEDKFNDWASRKLFLIADEVVARLELFHTKNKLKSLITGEWIRINPKNMGAYDERNHVNLVFLSNETMPLVLERDDRRYTVIWTPPKLDPAFYETVRVEIEAGGIAALHDHLLHVDLADFRPWTAPPMTGAKLDLIELSLDSTERFWLDWVNRNIPLPLSAARSEDLYDAYRHWCTRQGVAKPAQASTFLGNCAKRPGAQKAKRRHYTSGASTGSQQSAVMWPPGVEPALDIKDLSDQLENFAESVATWRKERMPLREVA